MMKRSLSKRHVRFSFFEELRRLAYEKVSPELQALARKEIEKALKQEQDPEEAAELAKSWHKGNSELRAAINAVYNEEFRESPADHSAPRLIPLDESDTDVINAKREQKEALESLVQRMNNLQQNVHLIMETIEGNKQKQPQSYVQKKEQELAQYLAFLDRAEQQAKKEMMLLHKTNEIDAIKKSIINLEKTLENKSTEIEKKIPGFASQLG